MFGIKRNRQNEKNETLQIFGEFQSIIREFSDAVKSLEKTGGYIDKLIQWNEEFQRVFYDEYMKNGKKKVYSLVMKNAVNSQESLFLVIADTYEIAQSMVIEDLKRAFNYQQNEWVVAGFKSITVNENVEKVLKKTEEQVKIPEKPISVFLNDMLLVKDRFAETSTEKRSIEKIINRIKTKIEK